MIPHYNRPPSAVDKFLGGVQKGGERGHEFAKMAFDSSLREKERANKLASEELSLPDYETFKDVFGEKAANLYKSSPTGGKTALLQAGLSALERGEKIEDLLSGITGEVGDIARPEIAADEDEFTSMESSEQPRKVSKQALPDYTKRPKGWAPKEWRDELKEWRKDNSKNFETTKDRIKGTNRDVLGTKKLKKLNDSKKLPEGFERFLIDPETGGLRTGAQIAGLGSPEAQEWVKEIARFGNRAKEAFGSRVTNFDLIQYMRQFPSLLNTKEGRNRILKMMEINYALDSLYDKTVESIYDQKGLGGIPPEEVDRIARARIGKKVERLRDEYLDIEEENEMEVPGRTGGGRRSIEDIYG